MKLKLIVCFVCRRPGCTADRHGGGDYRDDVVWCLSCESYRPHGEHVGGFVFCAECVHMWLRIMRGAA